METNQYDIAIVGGGIVGLASGFQLQTNFPNLRIVIFEKENELAFHQTGNNSGVIHSGLYYKSGSYKANNCVSGRKLLIQFAKENNIDFDVCGKLVVAVNNDEAERLIDLKKNGEKNGLIGLKILEPKEFKKIEPNISGVKALWVPQSGIIDYKSVTNKLAKKILSINSKSLILTGCKVLDFFNNKIITSKGNFYSRHNIFCGGLFSDRLAIKDRLDLKMQIVGVRGDYYRLSESAKSKIKNLIYPVPNPDFPFLGVHFTRMIGGGIEAGPNAVLAFSKEGYSFWNFKFSEFFEILFFSGFIRVAFKYWRMGAMEMYRSLSKTAFTNSLQKLVPSIEKDDLVKCDSGVRAQACDAKGNLIDDFLILNDNNIINVVNAPSPAATSAISIANHIIKLLKNNSNEK